MAAETKEELREAKRAAALVETRLRTQIMETQLARVKKLKESQEYFSVVDGVSEVFDRIRGRDEDFAYPLSNANDRRYGANWPFWRTLIEHSRIRATARLLCTTNSQAIGILGGLSAFIIGSGMVYRAMARKNTDPPKELLAAVQFVLDDFGDRNDWSEMEQELFRRSRRDGEYFLRHFFLDDGTTIVYPCEPEWILEPPEVDRELNSFGVYNAKGNLYKIEGYWVASNGVTGEGEFVPIGDIDHIKINVDRIVKRGLSDFSYDCYNAFKRVGRLLENLTEGGAIQAAIAFIRQHETASPSQVDDFISATSHFVNQNPTTRQAEKVHKYNPGEIVDIDKGQTYLAPPFAANTPGFVQIIQAGLRSVAQRWNAPEWLSSADSSNGNFASSLVAESPFVRKCKEQQEMYRLRFLRTHWKAVRHAAECGRIYALGRRWSWDELKRVIELQATPPTVEVRNKMQEAQTAQIEIQAGMGSRQEYAQAQGKDWERIEQDNEEYQDRHGGQGGQLPGGDEGGNPFGGGGNPFGGDDGGDPFAPPDSNAEHDFEMEGRTSLPLVGIDLTESQRDAAMLEAGFTGRSGKFCYQDGKRIPCPKTGEPAKEKPKGKAATEPKPKPAKPVLADTHEHVKGLLADPSKLTPQAVGDLAARLQGHTVADLQKLKAELKLKASGPKAELARKIAERALGAKSAEKPKEPAAKPEPKPAPAKPFSPADHAPALADAVKAHGGKSNLADIADVRDTLAKQGLSREKQDSVINHAMKTGEIIGAAYEGRGGLTPRQQAAKLPERDGPGIGHLMIKGGTPQPESPKPAASKPAAKPAGKAKASGPVDHADVAKKLKAIDDHGYSIFDGGKNPSQAEIDRHTADMEKRLDDLQLDKMSMPDLQEIGKKFEVQPQKSKAKQIALIRRVANQRFVAMQGISV